MTHSKAHSYELPSATKQPVKCKKCGATTRLNTGLCVNCLLLEGLDSDGEVSQADYQSVLAEADAPPKYWFLGNYKILEQIGCGGMGVIYRARQRHSRRIVAIKRVLSYRADSRGALERFRREAQAVASLDHPNILPIYEVSESEDGLPFFSMKFAEKGSLRENVASLRDEPAKCVKLIAKVARAVEYAHSRGVLHRDLKPGNILLDDRNEPLVSDFGLAKLVDANNDLTRSLTTFGTAGFIAPEQAGGAAADFTPAADVYSLGAVLFNLLAGRPPFLGSNPVSVIREASETQAPNLRSLAPSLDRDLETICARCLERDPNARYKSAGDLAADLEHWLVGRPIVARPVSAPTRVWRWSRRNPRLVGAATTGLFLGAAAVWLFRGELVHEQPGTGVYYRHSQGLFTDVIHPIEQNTIGISVPMQYPSNPFTAPDHISPRGFDPGLAGTQLTSAPPEMGVTAGVRDRASQAAPQTNKITAHMLTAPPETGVTTNLPDRASKAALLTNKITADVTAASPATEAITSVRDRSSRASPRTNKIIADVTAASSGTEVNTSVPDRVSQAALRTNKTASEGPASIEGFVKDTKGQPIKGTDVRIESRDGKQLFSTLKTDSKGRYTSQGLQPGVYRVTLLVDGSVKASITNTQAKANQPTQLNFELKPPSQADNIAKRGKRMVWVPARTGSHIGGNWVEVDDGKAHSRFNVQTVTTRNW